MIKLANEPRDVTESTADPAPRRRTRPSASTAPVKSTNTKTRARNTRSNEDRAKSAPRTSSLQGRSGPVVIDSYTIAELCATAWLPERIPGCGGSWLSVTVQEVPPESQGDDIVSDAPLFSVEFSASGRDMRGGEQTAIVFGTIDTVHAFFAAVDMVRDRLRVAGLME